MSGRRTPRRTGFRRGRGFTVIEVLLVLAIVAALAAIVLPALQRWVAAARFRETCAQIESVFERCRAAAQRRGTCLLVSVETHASGAVLSSSWVNLEPAPRRESSATPTPETPTSKPEYMVPGGLVIRSDSDSSADADAERHPADTGVPQTEAAARPLVLFAPDGSALGGGWTIADGRGRQARAVINRWLGSVTFAEVAAAPGTPDSSPAVPPAPEPRP